MKIKMKALVFFLLVFPLTSISADKQKASPKKEKRPAKKTEQAPEYTAYDDFEAQLKYQGGTVVIGGGLATLAVPAGFKYLDPEQSEKVLVEGWGNRPGKKTLGMLFPSDTGPLDEDGWGVVITYDEDGFVKDDDAEGIDYAALLKQMKEDIAEENPERKTQGYESIELVGWAAPPHYDKSSHKLYWARELKFGDQAESTLNYDIRVLGRKGVLSLNAVSSISLLNTVRDRMQDVPSFVQFSEGNQYSDFNPSVDKIAAYGIGALIAGKIAAKVGFFKLLLGGLAAFKKFIVVGVAALLALLRKFFRRNKSETSGSPPVTPLNLE